MKTALATEKIAHEIRNTLQVLTMTLREVNCLSTGNQVVEHGICAAENYATNLSHMLEEIVRKERERIGT
jgi:hypothetical protein